MLKVSLHTTCLLRELLEDIRADQPAMTALIATFSTVHGAKSGGTVAIISSNERVVPCRLRRARSSRLEVRPVSRLSNRGGT